MKQEVTLTHFLLSILILIVFFGFFGPSIAAYLSPLYQKISTFVYSNSIKTITSDRYTCKVLTKNTDPQVKAEYERCLEAGKRSGKPFACFYQMGTDLDKKFSPPI